MKLMKPEDIVVGMYIFAYATHDSYVRNSYKVELAMYQLDCAGQESIENLMLRKYSKTQTILFFEPTYEELLEHYVLEHI